MGPLPNRPGVYRFIGPKGVVLYVGKAKDLKKRVTSYFRGQHQAKTQVLLQQAQSLDITLTTTENEALLFENNLIKELKPRYNVLLRDDKSYPYIYLSQQEFPRLEFHRGARREKGRYFGPFPSASSVRENLSLLQKLFKIRQCSDSFFQHRDRPCLQYQIKRCTAPCVGYITPELYQKDVQNAILFLEGKNNQVIEDLSARMEEAAKQHDYESAARYRDQIRQLRQVQEEQYVTQGDQNVDVIALASQDSSLCVTVLILRAGRLLGNKSFFPDFKIESTRSDIIASFISQYYGSEISRHDIPQEILVEDEIEDATWLSRALCEQAGHAVKIYKPQRGPKTAWIKLASTNAQHALQTRQADESVMAARVAALQQALGLEQAPLRIECFDISHSSGEATVASCVVFSEEGPIKSDYRRFNIEGITPGDDYAALHQAIHRRYARIKAEEGKLPDILFIDGGKGQLKQAVEVFEELQIQGVLLVSIAKGPERRPGLETLYFASREEPLVLGSDHPALHLIAYIRDEAHRFAITGHRQRRDKKRQTSALESIPGVGPKKRKALLHHLGGLEEVKRARIEELMRVPGIHRPLAERIHRFFNEE